MIEEALYAAGLVMATLLSVALVGLTWQYRHRPGAMPFLVLVGGLAVWTGALFFGMIDPSVHRTLVWHRLSYAGIPIVLVGWILFALEFTGREEWITARTLALLAIAPVALQLGVWTNEYHQLIWHGHPTDPFTQTAYGIGFWMHALYSYGLLFVGTALLLSFALYSRTLYRDQVLAIVAAAIVPWVANLLYLFTDLATDLTPIALGLSSAAFAWSMFRYGFMDVVPVARETVIDEMNDGVLVLDADRRVVDLNRAIHPLLEGEESHTVGTHVGSVLARSRLESTGDGGVEGPTVVAMDEDADSESGDPDVTAFLEGDPTIERTIEVDLLATPSDEGTSERRVRRTYELTLSPFYARKSTRTGQLLVAQDITVRKRRERQLSSLAEQLEHRTREQSALIGNIPGMVYRTRGVTSDSCAFVSQGAESITGYPAEVFESGDRSIHDLVHGEDRQRVLEQKRVAIDNDGRYDVTYRIRDGEDTLRWVRDVGGGVYTSQDELASVVGVVLDVTSTKEREQLQVLNRVLRHNIRNEMNVIKGYTDLAKSKADEAIADELGVVSRKSDEIMRLSEKARVVQQLLGTPSGADRTVELFDALATALEKLEDRYGKLIRGRIDVGVVGGLGAESGKGGDGHDETNSAGDPFTHQVTVYGSDLLGLALYELLENAVVHGGEPPELAIEVVPEADTAEIHIVDNGPGIPETEQRVLEDGLESPLEHGSGMGLWICEWVLTPYGDLVFERGGVGGGSGTTAVVSLRRSPEEPTIEPADVGRLLAGEDARAEDVDDARGRE